MSLGRATGWLAAFEQRLGNMTSVSVDAILYARLIRRAIDKLSIVEYGDIVHSTAFVLSRA